MRKRCGALLALLLVMCGIAVPADRKTRNIIFVMMDGLRWQEVFGGAEAALMDKEHGSVGDIPGLKREFWRDTADARRETLMPFLWNVVAKQGQVWGNRGKGSDAFVTNGLNFSYPGYNETLCGFADPRVHSNDKVPNPNTTVLEWLHQKPAFRGKVAAFGAWDVFPFIFNVERAGFLVNAGYAPLAAKPMTPQIAMLNRLRSDTRVWPDEAYDSFTFQSAMEYLKSNKPRVMFVGLGESDEWAHDGKYDLYLRSAHRADAYVKELWDTVQAMKEYRGNTTLIFSPDHGRGEGPQWKSHGEKIPDSKYIWMAFLGPDTRPLGERKDVAAVMQNQIAGTLAALLGEDYAGAVPQAGRVIADVAGK